MTRRTAWIIATFVVAAVSWLLIALPYLTLTAQLLPLFDGEREWILLHVGLGVMEETKA